MKKFRIRLDGTEEIVYVLRVGDEIFGPYANAAAARKAASRTKTRGEVLRVSFIPTVTSAGIFDGE